MYFLFIFYLNLVDSSCYPRRETVSEIYKEREYVRDSKERQRLLREIDVKSFSKHPAVYYLMEPIYSCDVDSRVGNIVGDGAKYVCNFHNLKHQDRCIYYGFGVDGEVVFEESLVNLVECEMHAFDPTPSVVSGKQPAFLNDLGVQFHAWGVSKDDEDIVLENQKVPAFTLSSIRRKLNHTNNVIDIVKIDTEGAEWGVFENLLQDCNRDEPYAHQFLVELHHATPSLLINLYQEMERCGYRVFHKDANHFCDFCMEYAFVHWKFLKCR